MSKATKIWLVTAAFLVVVGLVIIVAVSAFHWEFTDLSTEKYETNTYEISEEFSSITINTDTADILFVASDDDTCRVVCYEQEKIKHFVDVQDGTLTINVEDDREWYEHIGINLHSPKVTVYLPKAEYASLFIKESTGDIEIPGNFSFESIDISISTGAVSVCASASEAVKLRTSTGDIRVEGIAAKVLDLSASTGKVTVSSVNCDAVKISVSTGEMKLTDVMCNEMHSSGTTGDVLLKNVIAAGKLSLERSTGDVTFDGCDAAEIFVKTDTGDVTGTLLSEKVFITETDTGSVDVPKSVTGGRCEVSTDTGDIKFEVNP